MNLKSLSFQIFRYQFRIYFSGLELFTEGTSLAGKIGISIEKTEEIVISLLDDDIFLSNQLS